MNRPVILLGAGGHAKVLLDGLHASYHVEGVLTPAMNKGDIWKNLIVLGDDDWLDQVLPDKYLLLNGIGSLPRQKARHTCYESYKEKGFTFLSVCHSSAIVAASVQLGESSQVMAGAIVQADTIVGRNCIINSGAIVDHDCTLNDHVHVAPGVTISGGVTIGEGVHIGTGASVIQGIKIGANSIIGAGVVLTSDVGENVTIYPNKHSAL